MGERAYNRLARKYEVEDSQRLERACERIVDDSDLRFFIRHLLDISGMGQNPFTGNALTTAYNSGRMAIGQELVDLLSEVSPNLQPTLIKETNDEREERQRNLHDRLSDTGGE
jgi:hypothetical protein